MASVSFVCQSMALPISMLPARNIEGFKIASGMDGGLWTLQRSSGLRASFDDGGVEAMFEVDM